jgi:hypothetical protein
MRQRTGKKVKGIHNYMSTKRLNNKEYINLAESCNLIIINENEVADSGKHDPNIPFWNIFWAEHDPNSPYQFEWDDLVSALQADPGRMDLIMDVMGPITAPPPLEQYLRWNKTHGHNRRLNR